MSKRKKYLNAVEHYQVAINRESFNHFYGDEKAGDRYAKLKAMQKKLVDEADNYYGRK